MKEKKAKVGVLMVAVLICSCIGVYFYTSKGGMGGIVAEAAQTYFLANPALGLSTTEGTTFLEEEAGMSIYIDIGESLNLSIARTVIKNPEKNNSDYIIGSLSLPNLPETEDVHCFVHKDGWIVVYYLKSEPVSKIIDWNYYSPETGLTKTKLQLGLEMIGNAYGKAVTNAEYYNFQYPHADKWMIIIDTQVGEGTDSFNLKIPSEFIFYERSWSHCTYSGTLDETQLSPDVFHTVTARVYRGLYGYTSYLEIDGNRINSFSGSTSNVAVVLVYKEP